MALRPIGRRTGVAAASLAVLLLATACGGDDPASGSGSGGGGGTEDTISMTFGTAGTPVVYGSLMMHVADEEGFLEKYGLDVEFQNFANGADSVRAVIGGQLDAALTSTSSLVNVVAQGAPVTGMVGMDKPDYYIATTDPSITSCEDLRGQTIGVDQTGGARYNSTVTMLGSCGLTVDDVEFVNFAGPPIIQALVQGQITVGNLHYDEEAFIESTTDVQVEEVLSLVKDVNPDTHYVLQVATTDYIEQNREAVVRLTAAYIDANEFVRNPENTERFAEIASKYNKQPVEVAQQAVELFLDFEFWPEGSGLDETKIMGVVQEQIDAGAITEAQAPSYEDLVDPSIYEEAMELVESTS
ncbi:ABC transporter substrate-binding protein [Geodermatophilus sp. YIM 151500]|uniref:ABC transporter substrate-binding protein n=1 Tax=Geodermatophilus sp. YIM 151500 TaxID=2984531 RepID=UPI0021E3AADA|nr:ABC transporter substrate-binding protein [Geodermatophilus sp. YIM 151500]MCV2488851.1 ABC transporter substrate-binding protein [Geodermatophilus sp. YIM 151500]